MYEQMSMEELMTPYNYTAGVPLCKVRGESGNHGFLPVSPQVREIQKNAVIQAGDAFKTEREEIYSALTALDSVISYVRTEGFTALSADEDFRGGKPYVLDMLEEKDHGKVPLRKYLEFGLEHLSSGDEPELLEELMINKYHANSYAAADALIASIYLMGVKGMPCGMPFSQMLEYFTSVIPDAEADAFEAFAQERRKQEDGERYRHMREKLKQKFEKWDADRDTDEMDRHSMMTIFNEMTASMNGDRLKELIRQVSNEDLCYALLGADGENRKHIMELLTEEHRFILMENWMDMPFSRECVENYMEAMGRIVKTWVLMQKE